MMLNMGVVFPAYQKFNEQTITDIQKNEGNDRPSFLGTEAKMVKTEMSGGRDAQVSQFGVGILLSN